MYDTSFLIPLLPLVGFAVLLFFGRRIGDPKAGWIGSLAITASFLATLVVWLEMMTRSSEAGFREATKVLFDWISVGGFEAKAALLIDPLSITMALFVTGVSALIHFYSIGYMKGDPRYHQFFMYLNLFVFSMLMLVLGDNLLVTFLGWEGVGACSYFLVGFWFERETAATAAKKAFLVNRIGDAGFLLGIFLIVSALGTVDYVTDDGSGFLQRLWLLPEGTVTAIGLLLFVGAVGKSAQLPLYVWLPDAMEGPTPVSALIHAATMVTAGVYLMVRIAPVLALSETAALVVAIVGVASAFFAATVACAQNDIKRVLAYSTMSQLGYMFLAVGAGAYAFSIFHMITHAFFKALLFLSAGAVIHALHEQQDLKKMGNLRKYLPVTFLCFLVGWLAICGVPPFSGFWSKDEILVAAFEYNKVLYGVALVTVLLTAFYMSRLFFLAFYGKDRWSEPAATATAEHGVVTEKPHESPAMMLVPMVVLAVLSFVGGLLNVPFVPKHIIETFLEPSLEGVAHTLTVASGTELLLAVVSVALSVIGILSAWLLARGSSPWPLQLEPRVLVRAWFVDPLYSWLFEKPGRVLATWFAFVFDNRVVDGLVMGSARVIGVTGSGLRRVQSGFVRSYAMSIAGGTMFILVWALIRSSA